MRRVFGIAGMVLALAAVHSGVQTQTAPAGSLTVTADSKVWVEGGSTVRSWKCAAKAIDATVQTGAEGPVANLDRLVAAAKVTINTAELECGNNTMNEHMRKALKQTEQPTIAFKLASYTLDPSGALSGTLQMAGKELPIQFPATITDDGTTIRVVGNKAINMKEWGIKPPSLMMGTMKVKELVTINFDLTVKR